MKVIISSEESYEFNLPNEISLVQLDSFVERLNKIIKVHREDLMLSSPSSSRKVYSKRSYNTGITREKVIEALKYHLNKKLPKEEREKKVLDITGRSRNAFAWSLYNWKRKYHITDSEIKKIKSKF